MSVSLPTFEAAFSQSETYNLPSFQGQSSAGPTLTRTAGWKLGVVSLAARGKTSRRRPAAGDLAELGVIASGHASDIAPEIFMAFSGGAQRRIEVRTQRAGNEGEDSCIDDDRLAAHEERLGPKKIRNRSDRSRAERDDLGSRVPAHALAVDRALELSPDEGDHERAHRRRDLSEEIFRTLGEVGLIEPARIDERPIEIVLRHLFERPSDGALLRR